MKISKWYFMTILVVLVITAAQIVQAAAVKVSWQSNSESDLAGYRVYYGTSSRSYSMTKDVGLVTSTDINGLNNGTNYYFAVTAYDASGNESTQSQEIIAAIPAAQSGGNNPGSLVDSDADGIPDSVEILWGLDPNNPLDSLEDPDGDGVVNLVEYMASTDPKSAASKPVNDNVLKDIIGVVGEPIDLSSFNPTGSYSIIPLMAGVPAVINNTLDISNPGAYLYNVNNANGNLVYRLRVSVTSQLFTQGSYAPGAQLSLEDLSVGISIQIRADASLRNVPIGIGNTSVGSTSAISYDSGNGVEFDVLPYGLALAQPATITVNFDKQNPVVQRYDENDKTWKNVSGVTVSGNQVSFSTQELGKFRITSEGSISGSASLSSSGSGSSSSGGGGGGGGCFITTAGL
jgi:hypothetical protein